MIHDILKLELWLLKRRLLAFVSRLRGNPKKMYLHECPLDVTYKKKHLCVSRNVFRRRFPRGVTMVKRMKTVKSSMTLLHLAGIVWNGYTRLPLFVFARLHLCSRFSTRFFSLLLSWPSNATLYSLLVYCLPLLLPKGDCCCGFLSRYVPRIRSFRFYLPSNPFVTKLFHFFLFKISVAPLWVKSLRRQIQPLIIPDKRASARIVSAR